MRQLGLGHTGFYRPLPCGPCRLRATKKHRRWSKKRRAAERAKWGKPTAVEYRRAGRGVVAMMVEARKALVG